MIGRLHTKDSGFWHLSVHPYNLQQDSQETDWLQERRLYDITASEVPVVYGLNTRKTPMCFYKEKWLGQEHVPSEKEKEAMRYGKEHEDEGRESARAFLDKDYLATGLWPLRGINTPVKIAGSPDGVELDAQGNVVEVLEIKCPLFNRVGLDMPNAGHVAQLLTNMAVCRPLSRETKPAGCLFYWTPQGCRAYKIREPRRFFWEEKVLPVLERFVDKAKRSACLSEFMMTSDTRRKHKALMMSCVRGILYTETE